MLTYGENNILKRYFYFIAVGFVLLVCLNLYNQKGFQLQLSRTQAIEQGYKLDQKHNEYQPLAFIFPQPGVIGYDVAHRFVWQHDRDMYDQLIQEGYLQQPHWVVRKASFEGDVEKRSSEAHIHLNNDGTLHHKQYIVPQSEAGVSLQEADVIKKAYQALAETFGFKQNDVEKVSVVPTKQPARTDWEIHFRVLNGIQLKDAQLRVVVTVAGDEVTLVRKYVHVPEVWQRTELAYLTMLNMIKMIMQLLFYILIFVGIFYASSGIRLYQYNVKRISFLFCGLFIMVMSAIINLSPLTFASFQTAMDWMMQLQINLMAQSVSVLMSSMLIAVAFIVVLKKRFEHEKLVHFYDILNSYGFGALLGFFIFFLKMFILKYIPQWQLYSYSDTLILINSYSPLLLIISSQISHFFKVILGAIALKYLYDRILQLNSLVRVSLISIGLVAISFIVSSSSVNIYESISLFIALLVPFLISLMSRTFHPVFNNPEIIRSRRSLMAYVIGAYSAYAYVPLLFFNPFPTASYGFAVVIIVLFLIAAYFPLENEEVA